MTGHRGVQAFLDGLLPCSLMTPSLSLVGTPLSPSPSGSCYRSPRTLPLPAPVTSSSFGEASASDSCSSPLSAFSALFSLAFSRIFLEKRPELTRRPCLCSPALPFTS